MLKQLFLLIQPLFSDDWTIEKIITLRKYWYIVHSSASNVLPRSKQNIWTHSDILVLSLGKSPGLNFSLINAIMGGAVA